MYAGVTSQVDLDHEAEKEVEAQGVGFKSARGERPTAIFAPETEEYCQYQLGVTRSLGDFPGGKSCPRPHVTASTRPLHSSPPPQGSSAALQRARFARGSSTHDGHVWRGMRCKPGRSPLGARGM